jgi:hypothetical protein
MKKLIIITFAFTLLFYRCNDSGSSSDSQKGLKLNPETLTTDKKYNRPLMSYAIEYPPSTNNTGNYAIIYSGTVNSIRSVGIAVAENPKTAAFNMKIYFQADSIPEGNLSINETNSSVRINGTKSASHSINMNFIKETDGTYTINGTGTIGVTAIAITINSIKARLAGADDSSGRK